MYEYEKQNCSYTCESKKDMLYVADKVTEFLCAHVGLEITQQAAKYTRDHVEVDFTVTVNSTDYENYPASNIELFGVECCSCCRKKKMIVRRNLKQYFCCCCKTKYNLCEHCVYHKMGEDVVENRENIDMATTKFCSISCASAHDIAPSFSSEEGER